MIGVAGSTTNILLYQVLAVKEQVNPRSDWSVNKNGFC